MLIKIHKFLLWEEEMKMILKYLMIKLREFNVVSNIKGGRKTGLFMMAPFIKDQQMEQDC